MRAPIRLRHALAASLLLAACAPAPREARLEPSGGAPAVSVEGAVGSGLTQAEIREGFVEPRCSQAGLVMVSLRVRRMPDGSQSVTARCGLALR